MAGLAVAAVTFGVLLATLPEIGLTDDADAYLSAAVSYAGWGDRVLTGDGSALRREGIDRRWRMNAEHPPLAKLAMGATWWLFHHRLGWLGNVAAARVGIVLLATLLAWLLFSLCWDHFGRIAGLTAPLLLVTMPRFFFDAHAETLDAAVASTCFLALAAFFRALRSRAWAVGCGAAFGLALASKLNAPFLLLSFAGLLLARPRSEEAGGPRGPFGLSLSATAWVSLLVLGPLVFFLSWPWLWFDTWARLAAYVRFHLHHYGILFFYFGHIYESPPAPWHAPFVMTAITTPPVGLALGAAGLVRALVEGMRHRGTPEEAARRDLALLLAFWAFTAIGTVAFSGAPKYGGVKLFLPMFPPFAALGGWMAQGVADALRRRVARRWAGPAVATALVLPGALSLARIHPYHLSYYNAFVGGLPGAVRAGFERQYYDLIYVDLIEWMNGSLPRGTRVTFLPNNKEYVRNSPWWFADGRIRSDLRFTGPEAASVLVLTHERRWPQYPALRDRFRSLPVLWELRVEQVPLLTVYRLR